MYDTQMRCGTRESREYNSSVRRTLLAAAMLLAASCGGSPVSPSPPAPAATPGAVTLESGPYTLAIAFSATGRSVCRDGFCFTTSLCIGNPSPATASFSVAVERSGNRATVRVPDGASSLVVDLELAPALVTGTISGSARDAQGVVMEVSGTVSGAPSNAPVVSGHIDGQLSVAGGSCSNNGHTWSLSPR